MASAFLTVPSPLPCASGTLSCACQPTSISKSDRYLLNFTEIAVLDPMNAVA